MTLDDRELDRLLGALRDSAPPLGHAPHADAWATIRRGRLVRRWRRRAVTIAGTAAVAATLVVAVARLPDPWSRTRETVLTAPSVDRALAALGTLRGSTDPRALAIVLAAARAPAARAATAGAPPRPPATAAASDPTRDTVARAAAVQLAAMRVDGVGDTLFRFLADTTVPLARRQAALSPLQYAGGTPTLPMARVRALYPFLHGGSAHSTLFEVLIRAGDDADREWVWSMVLREDVPAVARLTGLQLLGSRHPPAELDSLLRRPGTRLVRYGILQLLGGHPDAEAHAVLQRFIRDTPDPLLRDAAKAAMR